MHPDLHSLSAVSAARAVGLLSPVSIISSLTPGECLRTMEPIDPWRNAVIHMCVCVCVREREKGQRGAASLHTQMHIYCARLQIQAHAFAYIYC